MASKNISAAKKLRPGPENVESANQVPPETLTVSIDYAAKILGISRAAAYNYARDGSLPTIKIGGAKRHRLLVPKAALNKLLLPA
jgi:predicted DNA-binding transcriptional regulator AlpA